MTIEQRIERARDCYRKGKPLMAATQSAWTDEDEKKHPRDAIGEFSENGHSRSAVVDQAYEKFSAVLNGGKPAAESGPLKAVHAKFQQELDQSGLPTEKQAAYLQVAHNVLQRMPDKALQSLQANVTMMAFYPDVQKLTDEFVGRMPFSGVVGGVWESLTGGATGVLHLDGSFPKGYEQDKISQEGIYAHEFGHAADWSGAGHISDSRDWKAAWYSELSDSQLCDYATTDLSEGFAEFARLCWGSTETPEQIQADFPKCYSVFKQHGLV